jgi:hypothetical protein
MKDLSDMAFSRAYGQKKRRPAEALWLPRGRRCPDHVFSFIAKASLSASAKPRCFALNLRFLGALGATSAVEPLSELIFYFA